MSTFDSFLLDLAAVDGGRWVRHPIFGFEWCIASTRKPAFAKRRDELRVPHRALLAAAPQSEEAQRIIHDSVTRALA